MQRVPESGIISTPGSYSLASDYTANRVIAIKIECDNVTLDLNGYGVFNDYSKWTSFGICAMQTKNTVIKNGNIQLCQFGIHAPYCQGIKLVEMSFEGCTYIAANIGGTDARVSRCSFRNISGCQTEAYAIGLNISEASNAVIEDNVFNEFYRQPICPADMIGEGVGILLGHDTSKCVVRNNILRNSQQREHTYAIWAAGIGHRIVDNRISNVHNGLMMGESEARDNVFLNKEMIYGSIAIAGNGGLSETNLIVNFDKPYSYESVGDTELLLRAIRVRDDCVCPTTPVTC